MAHQRKYSRQKLPSPLPGVQSNEERRRMKQDLSRKKKKDVNEKRVLARKKHARKVVQSYGTPERTPSLSPDSKTKLMQRHGNFKTPRFDDQSFSEREGRKLDLPAAAKDKNIESGRPPYRGGEAGGGRAFTIYASNATVGKHEPYRRGTVARSTRKANVSYVEPASSSSPASLMGNVSSPASSSSSDMSSPIPALNRSDSINLSSEESFTPPRPRRYQEISAPSSVESRPSPSIKKPLKNTRRAKNVQADSLQAGRSVMHKEKRQSALGDAKLRRQLSKAAKLRRIFDSESPSPSPKKTLKPSKSGAAIRSRNALSPSKKNKILKRRIK
ncbi:hypothetical protein P389DRAFT_193177 [Cystobasidium minutum MCA 4210]|uniref:uncharacterized protein n=1 Tax=Cystobasidium minutum MCA 4210 TaxID=1397322 RepID=UPI0034CDD594|eukprot:jgi/Rhomi1/193177/gm1.1391_g